METSEQIKIAEQLLKFTQDYISVKKLLKTVKTNEAKSDLEKLTVEDWQLCKVLSNLIDNAMTALSENAEEKKLEIDINEDREHYLFSVSNNGTAIPEELQESIFKRGFSTKKESGHGMGLAIVSDIVKENIQLSSTDAKTEFTVIFRKGEGE